ncbi:hypothetical protein FOXYSP1_08967 [Fusarium oxysporum f. sp. phaseoli]
MQRKQRTGKFDREGKGYHLRSRCSSSGCCEGGGGAEKRQCSEVDEMYEPVDVMLRLKSAAENMHLDLQCKERDELQHVLRRTRQANERGCVSSGARHKTSPIDIGGLCFGEMVADFRIDRAELPTVNLLCDEEGFQAESVGAGLVRRLISRWIRFLFWCCRRNPRALEVQWDTMEYMSCSGLLSFDPRGGCLRQMWLVVVMVMVSRGTEKSTWESLIFVVSGSSIDMEAEPSIESLTE